MHVHSEVFVAKRYDLGVTFVSSPHIWKSMGQGGEEQQVTPKIVPLSISVFAVVANNVETALCLIRIVYSHGSRQGG